MQLHFTKFRKPPNFFWSLNRKMPKLIPKEIVEAIFLSFYSKRLVVYWRERKVKGTRGNPRFSWKGWRLYLRHHSEADRVNLIWHGHQIWFDINRLSMSRMQFKERHFCSNFERTSRKLQNCDRELIEHGEESTAKFLNLERKIPKTRQHCHLKLIRNLEISKNCSFWRKSRLSCHVRSISPLNRYLAMDTR
jgi:hypothetical protein